MQQPDDPGLARVSAEVLLALAAIVLGIYLAFHGGNALCSGCLEVLRGA